MHAGSTLFLDVCAQCEFWPGGAWPIVTDGDAARVMELFALARKRPLPRVPRAVGILTGADAAARGDLVATIGARFPATKVVLCETRVQGKGAAVDLTQGVAVELRGVAREAIAPALAALGVAEGGKLPLSIRVNSSLSPRMGEGQG